MKQRKFRIFCAIGGLIFLAVASVVLLSQRDDDEGRYNELLRARRAEHRFMPWRTNAAYRFVSRVTRYDLVSRLGQKADKVEASLTKSGALVWVSFFAHSSPRELYGPRDRYHISDSPVVGPSFIAPITNTLSGALYARCTFPVSETVRVLCRPQDVAYWQSAFCCITNRVRLQQLRNFALGGEEVLFLLPDGSKVSLDDCQKWLNQSIAEGWMVGVHWEKNFATATRRKPGGERE